MGLDPRLSDLLNDVVQIVALGVLLVVSAAYVSPAISSREVAFDRSP